MENLYINNEKLAVDSIQILKDLISSGLHEFIKLGYLLNDSLKWFKYVPGHEYKNVYEFASEELKLCSTNVKYYLNVFKRFSDNGQPLIHKDFSCFNFSQLREMLPLSESVLKTITPEMTVENIKSLKKNLLDVDTKKEEDLIKVYKEEIFKNKEERVKFLDNYTKWELFESIPEFDLKFYRAKMSGNIYIIATESLIGRGQTFEDCYFNKIRTSVNYCLLNSDDKDCRYDIMGSGGVSGIVNFITKKKLKYIKE